MLNSSEHRNFFESRVTEYTRVVIKILNIDLTNSSNCFSLTLNTFNWISGRILCRNLYAFRFLKINATPEKRIVRIKNTGQVRISARSGHGL